MTSPSLPQQSAGRTPNGRKKVDLYYTGLGTLLFEPKCLFVPFAVGTSVGLLRWSRLVWSGRYKKTCKGRSPVLCRRYRTTEILVSNDVLKGRRTPTVCDSFTASKADN